MGGSGLLPAPGCTASVCEMLRRLVTLAVLFSTAAWAQADENFPYDFRIAKLGNPQPGGTDFDLRANANFRVFARQLAAAMTSVNLMPPETLGHSGFAFSLEFSLVDFQGGSLPTDGAFKGPLKVPSVHVRKGLPFSFEVGARVAWLEQSRMGAGTVELKWALNEGFAYLPDIGVRGFVTKLINSRDFDVTAGGFDLGLGKQFAIAGMVTLTPYLGWSLNFVGATSGNVDFRPGRTLGESDTDLFKDYYVFNSLQALNNTHNRFYGGFRFIAGHAMLGAEISYSVFPTFKDVNGSGGLLTGPVEGTAETRSIPAVLTGNFTLGLDF